MIPKSGEELIADGVLSEREWSRMSEIHGLRWREKPKSK